MYQLKIRMKNETLQAVLWAILTHNVELIFIGQDFDDVERILPEDELILMEARAVIPDRKQSYIICTCFPDNKVISVDLLDIFLYLVLILSYARFLFFTVVSYECQLLSSHE